MRDRLLASVASEISSCTEPSMESARPDGVDAEWSPCNLALIVSNALYALLLMTASSAWLLDALRCTRWATSETSIGDNGPCWYDESFRLLCHSIQPRDHEWRLPKYSWGSPDSAVWFPMLSDMPFERLLGWNQHFGCHEAEMYVPSYPVTPNASIMFWVSLNGTLSGTVNVMPYPVILEQWKCRWWLTFSNKQLKSTWTQSPLLSSKRMFSPWRSPSLKD